ncbi:MAG: PEP-CTERM sorting domain-containing protein [Verrucomicrobiaceae bacterium]|nr:PEP-CTERM sorting domain-containing protein [Verrucomicrobiaceae bacterium]
MPAQPLFLPRTVIVLLFILESSCLVQARVVSWYSSVGDVFLKADGVERWDASLQFDLGAFKTGFVPTTANVSLWETNWLRFDHADADSARWNPDEGYLTSEASTRPAADGLVYSSSDPAGSATSNLFSVYDGTAATYQPAYIWAYNTQTLTGGAEWALIGNPGWTFPDPDPFIPYSAEFSLEFGGVAFLGGLSTWTVREGPAAWRYATLQTIAVSGAAPVVVPEPATALLMSVAVFFFRITRRRR